MRSNRIRMNPMLAPIAMLALLAAACGAPEAPPPAMDAPEETAAAGPPTFTYDPSWPRPLPNNWALGDVWGVAVDSDDNPWIAHANSDRIQALLEEEGKELAPPVIQFDREGNLSCRHGAAPARGTTGWRTPSPPNTACSSTTRTTCG